MKAIFDNDLRGVSESDLIYKVTKRKTSLEEFFSFDDILDMLTPSKKAVAEAIVELYNRMKEKEKGTPILNSSTAVFNFAAPILSGLKNEEAWIICLNHAFKPLRFVRVSKGGLTETSVDVRIVIRHALECSASCVILLHNHPSGNTRPSQADSVLTRNVATACKMMNLQLSDHIIIGGDNYYSFQDNGNF